MNWNKFLRSLALITFLFIGQFSPCKGQNLVPNPSFEEYNDPHCGFGFFDSSTLYWISPNTATPDYYSKLVDINCGNHPIEVTQNSSGVQEPADGIAFAGIITFTERNRGPCHDYSEYIQIQLEEPLVAGASYYCGFYTSLGDFREYASNNLGMFFSEQSVNSDTCLFLNYSPQINSEMVISNSDEWVLVSGTFVSNNSSRFLTIGNFYSDEETDRVFIQNNPVFANAQAYYFIDSVFVEPINDLLIPNVITPNNDYYNQTFKIDELQYHRWALTISNRWGQIVYKTNSYNNEWGGSGLNTGTYYYYLKHLYADISYKGSISIVK